MCVIMQGCAVDVGAGSVATAVTVAGGSGEWLGIGMPTPVVLTQWVLESCPP